VGGLTAAALPPTAQTSLYPGRPLSGDGKRLFFESYDPLLPQDTNDKADVYQWERAGTGGCSEAKASFSPPNGGCVSLISSGKAPTDSEFIDASPEGDDVFLATGESLLAKDPGEADLYDARVGGGFAADVEAEEFKLTVKPTGAGTGKVTSSPAGIDCGSDCDEEYEEGTEVTLTAEASAGSTFKGFSGAGCSGTGPCEVTLTEAAEVTAQFDLTTPTHKLTVATEGTGSGTVTSSPGLISCSPFCTEEYEAGTKVTLTATPAPGSLFYSWKRCDAGGVNGRQCTVGMDKAKTVTAVFITAHDLTVSKAPGSGLGKVQSSPGGILCLANCSQTAALFKEGAAVKLTPTPARHFAFAEWLGDCTGSGSCELSMGEDHEVEALFTAVPKHLLTLTKTGGGAGTVKSDPAGINCGATCKDLASSFYEGEVVELTATPGKGSAFGGWSGCDSELEGKCKVTISGAKEVEAEFK
jgi:hypothetical protein